MNSSNSHNNSLIDKIIQKQGTPTYIYFVDVILSQFNKIKTKLRTTDLICYAVKANSNLSILKLLAEQDSGFDVVSIGELKRVMKAGGKANKTVFSGVGKEQQEIEFALKNNILCLNVESEDELYLIEKVAKNMACIAPVSLRLNPDVDAKTHPYISTALKTSKFGIDFAQARNLYQYIQKSPHLKAEGIDFHIGSQMLETAPLQLALEQVLEFYEQIKKDYGIQIAHLDIGGGYGIVYKKDENEFQVAEFFDAVLKQVPSEVKIICEPGRFIVGNAGILATKVIRTKQNFAHNHAIVDSAMNDLIRPALYQAYHKIEKLKPQNKEIKKYDIVGPICETGDFIARDYPIENLEKDEILLVHSCGAYAFAMSSNYNTRNRCAEILVENDTYRLIRKRETFEQLIENELINL